MEKDWLVFTTGVVPAISSAVRKLTTVGENVLVQTPVYNIFFQDVYKRQGIPFPVLVREQQSDL